MRLYRGGSEGEGNIIEGNRRKALFQSKKALPFLDVPLPLTGAAARAACASSSSSLARAISRSCR